MWSIELLDFFVVVQYSLCSWQINATTYEIDSFKKVLNDLFVFSLFYFKQVRRSGNKVQEKKKPPPRRKKVNLLDFAWNILVLVPPGILTLLSHISG